MTTTASPHPTPVQRRHRRRWSALVVAGALVALIASMVTVPTAAATDKTHRSGGSADTYVAEWDALGSQAFTAAALSPAEGHTIFSYAGIAVYDSVVAISRDYKPFAIRTHAPKGASPEAAVVAAAHRIFSYYLPAQAPTILDPAYVTSLATIDDGQAKDDGIALGLRVANAVIAQRADDGFRIAVPYATPDPPIPGAWIPTATTPPIGTYLGNMTPFALESTDQFHPNAPPALGSHRWAADYNEVKAIGSATSTTRTDAQTLAARFWAEPPVQQARGSFRLFITSHGLDVYDSARFMAMMSVTYADALMACFEAKYSYAFWRPITAIRAGDTDGNDDTLVDTSWTPLLATPNHPEYPSAHSCITPAGGTVVARFLGSRDIDFTVPSLTGLGDRTYAHPWNLRQEVSNARVWGGIHFRSAVNVGARIAEQTVRAVLAHNFQRTRCWRPT